MQALGHDSYRIPTLDGWRGVAVLLVLLFHYQIFLYHRFLLSPAAWFGEHGVSIFFVASGFLITTNLLRKNDLRRFYIRRFFRLMPAAWIFLLTVSLLAIFLPHKVTIGTDLWACLFFYRNYSDPSSISNFTGHFWSLSVEEQFYLFWPLLLMAVGRKASAILALVGAISVAVYRTRQPGLMAQGYNIFHSTDVRIDAIMVGCLLAFVMSNEHTRQWITGHSAIIFWSCVPVLGFDFWRYQAIPPLHENAAIALMVAATVTNPRLIASRILELPYLKTTGMLCYGIYLWQGLLIRAAFGALGIALLPIAVVGSWVLIEKPSQRLADKLLAGRSATATPSLQLTSEQTVR
jgi:peptidoglycan/LPS O-acetylase OafA/YrhL